MSWQNNRNCNLELVLSMPDILQLNNFTRNKFWFPITSIDVPKFEITRNRVGILPNFSNGIGISSYDSLNKNGTNKIHCVYSIKTEEDTNIKQCLYNWWQKYDIHVPSVINICYEDNGNFLSEEINCPKTFISNIETNIICNEEFINFTFICDDLIIENI